MRATRITRLVWVMLLLFGQASAKSDAREPFSLYIDLSEGGSQSTRQLEKFNNFLETRQCDATVETGFGPPRRPHDIYFLPLIPKETWIVENGVNLALQANSLSGVETQGVIMVRTNTNVNSLKSLQGESFAYLNQHSRLGFIDQMQLFKRESLALSGEKSFASDNHSAALTLLLHKDVFAAFVEVSLAKKWGEANGLSVIASGPKRKISGIYISDGVNKLDLKACLSAFESLNRADRKGKSLLRLFPDWITAFKPLESSLNR